MPQGSVGALLGLLRSVARRPVQAWRDDPTEDVHRVGWDQSAARRQVQAVLTMRSELNRASVLAAARQELHLPLGAAAVPPGALHLVHADDSSVVVGSNARDGSRFRGVLLVRDCSTGSTAEYAVESWHERDGGIAGLRQLLLVRATVLRSLLSVDPSARVTDPPTDEDE